MGGNFDCLLDIIEEFLPTGLNDYDRVTEHHCFYYPGFGQMCEILRCKFTLCTIIRDPSEIPLVQYASREHLGIQQGVSDG